MTKLVEKVKIFILSIILSVMMIPSINCEAVDYYIGVCEDGSEAYLMTETIICHYHDYGMREVLGEYSFTVKSVNKNSKKVKYIEYFMMNGLEFHYTKNGKFYDFRIAGRISEGTVERNLLKYIQNVVYKGKNLEPVREIDDYEQIRRNR